MGTRAAAWLAWSACAFSLVLTALGLVVLALNRSHPGAPVFEFAFRATVVTASCSSVGVVIASRRPAHPPGEPFASGKMTQLDHVNRSPLRQNTVSRGKEPALGHSPPADRVQVFAG
jgi:hypothetical protein